MLISVDPTLLRRAMRPRSKAAIEYACRELARRAGLDVSTDLPGVEIHYGNPKALAAPGVRTVFVRPCSDDAFAWARTAAPAALTWLAPHECTPSGASFQPRDSVPALFWGEGVDSKRPFGERDALGRVIINVDIVAATIFMLTRWEEIGSSIRDQHDRFPASASFAHRQAFLDRPVVDEYAMLLREWIKSVVPAWRPSAQRFETWLTHDIDHVRRFRSIAHGLLGAIGGAQRRAGTSGRSQPIRDAWAEAFSPRSGPYLRGIATLLEIGRRYAVDRSAFYLMAAPGRGPQERYGPDYAIESTVARDLAADLRMAGVEIGIHPGYGTLDRYDRLLEEKVRFDRVIGGSNYGGRQHYLRFRTPQTWRFWDEAGFAYDSTVGFADHEGFRCGTCHPFHPFDVEQDRELRLLEIPLIVMDTTLRVYRNLSPEQGLDVARRLRERCRDVGGRFTILWHNTSLSYEWAAWAHVLDDLLSGTAHRPGSR